MSETVSPPSLGSTVTARTGRMSGAAAFSSFLQAANANKRTRVQTVPNPKDSDRVELFRAKPVSLIIGTALGLVWLKHGVAC